MHCHVHDFTDGNFGFNINEELYSGIQMESWWEMERMMFERRGKFCRDFTTCTTGFVRNHRDFSFFFQPTLVIHQQVQAL